MKIRIFEVERLFWGTCGEPKVITIVVINKKRQGSQRRRQGDNGRRGESERHLPFWLWWWGRSPQAKGCRRPLESGKARKWIPLEPLESTQSCQHDFSTKTLFGLLTTRAVRWQICVVLRCRVCGYLLVAKEANTFPEVCSAKCCMATCDEWNCDNHLETMRTQP